MVPSARRSRRAVTALAAALIGMAAIAIFAEHWGWDWLIARETRVRDGLTREHPVTGFAIGLAVFTALSFVPGLAGKTLVVGWIFGFGRGLVIANVGLTIAAFGEFALARRYLRDAVESRFGYYLGRANEAIHRDGAYYLFALRVAHAPYTVTNYFMGATRLTALGFWWSTQAGMLPGNLLFAYAGSRLPTLRDLSDQGLRAIFAPSVLFAFALLAIAPLLLRRMMRRSHS
ncbi:MAG: VTT domain-containing protein [Planctomycetes bacterium]|nr:VTT domain-containing protein [Planctomycetota bacterium]